MATFQKSSCELQRVTVKLGQGKENKQKKRRLEDAELKMAKKLTVGLQIMHSRPLIPGNTTHNWTGFPQRGIHPSHAINYSFQQLSLQHGYKTKAFSWNCG